MTGKHSKKTARCSKGHHQLPYGCVEPRTPLGVLLEDEDLLLKVLSYVMDEGLHECRLVCRQWRDACGKLLVELRRVPLNDLHKVPSAFPNTTFLALSPTFDSRKVTEQKVTEQKVIMHLSQMENLCYLRLPLSRELMVCNTLTAWFPVMDRLKTLGLRLDGNDTLLEFFCLLRRLTNLLSLQLVAYCDIRTELDPITELRGLRNLTVNIQLLVNNRTELLFPSLTELTCLNVVYQWYFWRIPNEGVDLKVCANRSQHALFEIRLSDAVVDLAVCLDSTVA